MGLTMAILKRMGSQRKKIAGVATTFSDLTRDFTPDRRARIEAAKERLREEKAVAELRQALQFTQAAVAETLGVQQAEVSKIENRTDIFVGTLRRFIQAMGGDLEIRAVFPDRSVTITKFASLTDSAPVDRSGD